MRKYIFTLLPLLLVLSELSGQENSYIPGRILDTNGRAIANATVIHEGRLIAVSDSNGFFRMQVSLPCLIQCYAPEHQDTVIYLRTRDSVFVRLHPVKIELEPILVSGKRIRNKIFAKTTSLEVVGRYYHIRSQLRIPLKLLDQNNRICLQACLKSDSCETRHWLRPIVLDGQEYRTGQLRLYSFDLSGDPLYPYLTPLEHQTGDLMIGYRDSVPIAIGKRPWIGQLNCYVVDFKNTKYRDSVHFVRGITNPIRWLQSDLDPIEIQDSIWIPHQQPGWHKESGKQSLQFKVNRPELDTSDSLSQMRFTLILKQLRYLLEQPEVRIHSLSIRGFASPDGKQAPNERLAHARAMYVFNALVQDSVVKQKLHTYPKISHQIRGQVHSWEDAFALAHAAEDTTCTSITDPRFRIYLAQLRYVAYEIEYHIYRLLSIQELTEHLHKRPEILSEHDFYRLVRHEQSNPQGKNQYATPVLLQQALTRYPSNWWFRNEIFRALWAQDSCNAGLTYLMPDSCSRPEEVNYNLALSARKRHNYTLALKYLEPCLNSSLPSLKHRAELLWADIMAVEGDYPAAWSVLSKEAGLNRILLRLAMHQNEEAYQEMKRELISPGTRTYLPGKEVSPAGLIQYIMAICAHRTHHLEESMTYLQEAVQINPQWTETAKNDGDLMDIISLIKPSSL